MHKLAVDFDIWVLGPAVLFLLITFAVSAVSYWNPSGPVEELRKPEEGGGEGFDWRPECIKMKRKAFSSALISMISVASLIFIWSTASDGWKVIAGENLWSILELLSGVGMFAIAAMTAYFAWTQERIKLLGCLLAMIFIGGAFQHFQDLTLNSRHVSGPEYRQTVR